MRITIVGAGNMGYALAGYFLKKNLDVVIFSEKGLNSCQKFKLIDIEGKYESLFNIYITNDTTVLSNEIILVTYPAFLKFLFVKKYGNFFKKGCYLGFIPGYGGVEYSCIHLIERGVIVFGFQRVPYVARMDKNKMESYILSKKNTLFLASIPYEYTNEICSLISKILDIKCDALKEYLAITLAPSNPILHIVGLYNAFKDDYENRNYSEVGFYKIWNDEASSILFKYDAEVQNICKKLNCFDLRDVVSLPIYYESSNPHLMSNKLKSIKSFEVVKLPIKNVNGINRPDLSNRMFTEDFPYGVCIYKFYAILTGVNTPIIDMLLEFYSKISNNSYYQNNRFTDKIVNTGIPFNFGLNTLEDIENFYHQRKEK